MDPSGLPLMQMITHRMEWLNQRQKVLAENIANANTPGYQAIDLEEPDFAAVLGRSRLKAVTLAVTNSGHIDFNTGGANAAVAKERDVEATPTGNTVVLEEQMIKVAETQMDYQLTANLYAKHISMLKKALGR